MCWLPTLEAGHTKWGMMGFVGHRMIFLVVILALMVYVVVQLIRRQKAHGGQSDAIRNL